MKTILCKAILQILLMTVASSFALAESSNKIPETGRERIVVSRGGVSLDVGLIDARISEIPEKHRAEFIDNGDRLEKMLRDMLLLKQLASEARAQGLHHSSLYAYQKILAEERVLAGLRLEQMREQSIPTNVEALANEVYIANPDRFKTANQVSAQHILIRIGDNVSEKEAKEKIDDIYQKVKTGVQSFDILAAEYSQDTVSAKQGGNLGFFEKEKMESEFGHAAFDLKNVGDISEPVKTRHGFHIIRLVEKKPATVRSFDSVKSNLMDEIFANRREKFVRKHTDELASMKIDANPELLGELRTRYGEFIPNKAAPEETPKTTSDIKK